MTLDGTKRIASLAEFLDSMNRLGPPGHLDEEQFPAAMVRVIV